MICLSVDSSRGGVERGLTIFSAIGVVVCSSSGLKDRLNGESRLPINLDLVGVADSTPGSGASLEFKMADLSRTGENKLILAGFSLATPSDRGLRASADLRVERNGRRGGCNISNEVFGRSFKSEAAVWKESLLVVPSSDPASAASAASDKRESILSTSSITA